MYLLIFPKIVDYEAGKIQHRKDDIDMSEIRPLVIEKIVVKAKKLKDIKKTSHHHHHGHHSHNGSSNDDSKDHSAEKVEEN